MIRFLMRQKESNFHGVTREIFYTVESVEELEAALTSGGKTEYECEDHELIGAEVIKDKGNSPRE